MMVMVIMPIDGGDADDDDDDLLLLLLLGVRSLHDQGGSGDE